MNESARGVRPWSRYIGTAHLKSRYNLTAGISGSYKDVPNAQPTEFGIHRGRPLGRNWLPQVKTFWAGRQDSARDSIRPPCSFRWRHRRGTSLDIRVGSVEERERAYETITCNCLHYSSWRVNTRSYAARSREWSKFTSRYLIEQSWAKFDETMMFKEENVKTT